MVANEKIEAIIKRDKAGAATSALLEAGVKGFSVSDIKGRGSGERPTVRGVEVPHHILLNITW